ncbi:hypothetical protein H6G80_07615 [Nostoc sp. FACHB-87]|uniref:hypothetical protein n=1 Tax=Nostocaceae TaxID=1162 RepID=UPI001683B5BF|nr:MULTISPECIES: hypothetical protein [Nostocaceae]MBD2453944.1 hypothetical protein [Nostoc sp. FACHB-87]MBD2476069.1 hypothetical protein [Anabaena sp. FACHB-83]
MLIPIPEITDTLPLHTPECFESGDTFGSEGVGKAAQRTASPRHWLLCFRSPSDFYRTESR